MAVRLVVTFHATPGKGAELTQAMKARCEISRQDAGCEQFEVFQSVFDPDKLVQRFQISESMGQAAASI
jgi:quinol monooxygenase YgiN